MLSGGVGPASSWDNGEFPARAVPAVVREVPGNTRFHSLHAELTGNVGRDELTTPQPPVPATPFAAAEPAVEAETVESSDDSGDNAPSA